jgi:SPP1 gp7 family putative phage head morphogenesis protein
MSSPNGEGQKSIKLTEDQLTIEWKRVDSRRVAYWDVLQKKFEPLYKKTGDAIIKSLGDNPDKKKINKAIDSTKDDWIKMFIAVGTVIIEDFGKQTEMRLKSIKPAECKFDPFADYVQKWLKAHAAESVVSVSGTLKDDMGLLITKATEDGLSVQQIASVIRNYYDDRSYSMAMRIARTETASAAGYAQHQTALDLGYTKKLWISARDSRTRDSHARMDGESKDINSRYSNGLMYPGDPSGSAGEVINCRCTETWSR